MEKLKEKLKELGYWKYSDYNDFIYIKFIRNLGYLKVNLEIDLSTLTGRIETNTKYYYEKDANDFVKAFNQLQEDLKILKEN